MQATICGFYGYNNYGDTLMLRGLQRFFESVGIKATGLSDRQHYEATHFKDFNFGEEKIVALGGGGIITPNFWFFKNGLEKKLTDQKFILLNVGLTTESIPILEKFRDHIDLVVVRDRYSENLAHQYNARKVIYAPDISNYRPIEIETEKSEKIVSICLNYYIFKNYFSSNNRDRVFAEKAIIELASFVDWLDLNGYTSYIFPCQTDTEVNDNTVNAVLNGFLAKKAKWLYSNYEVEDIISKSSLVISSRYHSTLFAFRNGIPFIDITHHSKNLNFLQDVGLTEFSINYWGLELNKLKELYNKVINFSELRSIKDTYGVYSSSGWTEVRSYIESFI